MPLQFTHRSLASKVVLRAGAIGDLPEELALLGCRRPLLLCGPGVKGSALLARVDAALASFSVTRFDAIPPHSSSEAVREIVARAAASQADCIVALGGGSASDTAKAVALLLAEGGVLEQHATKFIPPATVVIPPLQKEKLPIIAIPTTASAAEVTPSFAVRTPDGSKLLFWDARVASRLILIDPEATQSVPARVLLATGMNGLAHCLEGLYSTTRTPLTDALAIEGSCRFMRVLPELAAAPGDVAWRAELFAAAHLSGQVLVNARTGLHHAICHAIGALTGAAHGAANAVILPHALEFNLASAAAPLARAARALGIPGSDDDALARGLIERVRALQRATRVPVRLRELAIEESQLPGIAAKTLTERGLAFNPRRVETAREIEVLLEAAW